MKNKFAIFALAALILASFACIGSETVNQMPSLPTLTDSQAQETRVAVIDANQESFFTPEVWEKAPISCSQSMTIIIPENGYSSSGTILSEEQWIDPQGRSVWVYYLMVSNHAVGDVITPKYTLIPGTNTEVYTDYETAYIDYVLLQTTSGQAPIDGGILSVFTLERIERSNVLPLGIDKVKTGENIVTGETQYFTFGYPINTITAQYSVSKVKAVSNLTEPFSISLEPNNTTIYFGSSGGATCDTEGNVIGITTNINGEQAMIFNIVPLPKNISKQISTAITKSQNILQASNMIKAP